MKTPKDKLLFLCQKGKMRYIFPMLLLAIIALNCAKQDSPTIHPIGNNEIGKEKFTWDFNSNNTYKYAFHQTTNSVDYWRVGVEHLDTSEIITTGELNVKSKGDDLANLILNLTIQHDAFKFLEEGAPSQTIVVPNMNANGQFESKTGGIDILYYLIFPLPSKDLKVGESEESPLEFPFNLMGSPLSVKGYHKLSYSKDTETNTALIKSEFNVNELDVPEEIKGEFMCSFTGDAETEFDYEKKHFKSSKINLQIETKVKVDSAWNSMGKIDTHTKNTSRYDIKLIGGEK